MTNSQDEKKESAENRNNCDEQEEGMNNLHPKAAEYVKDLMREKVLLDHIQYPNAVKLIEKEIESVQLVGRAPPKENRYIDILRDWPIKVSSKILVPVRKFPRFNFVGKLLGPKGNSLKRLQDETMCRITVLGRGSMRDPQREEELRNSLEPKYGHLSDELNVEISALAPPAEAHARMSYALTEIKKFMIPDKSDDISLQQMEEMEKMSGQKPTPFRFGDARPPAGRGDYMIKKARMSSVNQQFSGSSDPFHYGGPRRQNRYGGPINHSRYGGPMNPQRYGGPMEIDDDDDYYYEETDERPAGPPPKPRFSGNYGQGYYGKKFEPPNKTGIAASTSWKTPPVQAASSDTSRFKVYTPYTRRT